MLTPEQIEGFRLAAGRLIDPINTYLLKDIARRIQDAGKLTSTAAYDVILSPKAIIEKQAELDKKKAAAEKKNDPQNPPEQYDLNVEDLGMIRRSAGIRGISYRLTRIRRSSRSCLPLSPWLVMS